MRKFMKKEGCCDNKGYMKKDGKKAKSCNKSMKEESCADDDFLSSLLNPTKIDLNQKFGSGLDEDALFALDEPQDGVGEAEPQAGDVGFSPQGKVGSGLGGGYTMDDFSDMPTLGQ